MACGMLAVVGMVLNTFVWEPLGVIDSLQSNNPNKIHAFILCASSLAALIFVGVIFSNFGYHGELWNKYWALERRLKELDK